MTTVNLHDAKTHLPELVAKACQGEEVVIGEEGESMVRLVPVVSAKTSKSAQGPRVGGQDAGKFIMPSDEAWDLSDREIEKLFDISANEPWL